MWCSGDLPRKLRRRCSPLAPPEVPSHTTVECKNCDTEAHSFEFSHCPDHEYCYFFEGTVLSIEILISAVIVYALLMPLLPRSWALLGTSGRCSPTSISSYRHSYLRYTPGKGTRTLTALQLLWCKDHWTPRTVHASPCCIDNY